jgi:hypothetical protein
MNSDLTQTSHSQSQKEAWEKLLGIPVAPVALQPAPDRRPRRLTAEACKIDNLLSHAIEYLTDDRRSLLERSLSYRQSTPMCRPSWH